MTPVALLLIATASSAQEVPMAERAAAVASVMVVQDCLTVSGSVRWDHAQENRTLPRFVDGRRDPALLLSHWRGSGTFTGRLDQGAWTAFSIEPQEQSHRWEGQKVAPAHLPAIMSWHGDTTLELYSITTARGSTWTPTDTAGPVRYSGPVGPEPPGYDPRDHNQIVENTGTLEERPTRDPSDIVLDWQEPDADAGGWWVYSENFHSRATRSGSAVFLAFFPDGSALPATVGMTSDPRTHKLRRTDGAPRSLPKRAKVTLQVEVQLSFDPTTGQLQQEAYQYTLTHPRRGSDGVSWTRSQHQMDVTDIQPCTAEVP